MRNASNIGVNAIYPFIIYGCDRTYKILHSEMFERSTVSTVAINTTTSVCYPFNHHEASMLYRIQSGPCCWFLCLRSGRRVRQLRLQELCYVVRNPIVHF